MCVLQGRVPDPTFCYGYFFKKRMEAFDLILDHGKLNHPLGKNSEDAFCQAAFGYTRTMWGVI